MTLPLLLNGIGVSALTRKSLLDELGGEDGRVLVLIKMGGGNDTLNTIIPLEYYDNLIKARPNIIIPEKKVLEIEAGVGFHPSMSGMRDLMEEGRLSVIRAVGYPNQNRSHFRSSDIWNTASGAKETKTTGWMGDYFTSIHPDYPDMYPNAEYPDPFAITLGASASETCQGPNTNFSYALTNINNIGTLKEGGEDIAPVNCFGDNLMFMREAVRQTNAYSSRVKDAYDKGENKSDLYEQNNMSLVMSIVARLIAGGLKTKLYIINLGGFDTHSAQVDTDDVTKGRHANLLSLLSGSVRAFQDDIIKLGLERRVMGMTYSEFGRRIKSNGSNGSDHGDAVGLFVFGECVSPGFIGDNPEISSDVGKNEAVPYQFDFRTVYGSILVDWFGASEDYVKENILEDFVKIPIISGCVSTSNTNVSVIDPIDVEVSPNPTADFLTVRWKSYLEHSILFISDEMGGTILRRQVENGRSQTSQYTFDLTKFPSGVYFIKVIEGHQHKVKRIVKI